MKDTIEERIRALQERKRELADEILSGEGMGKALISREEVLELLGKRE
jgi:SNF2 family DNA or RNA helicase